MFGKRRPRRDAGFTLLEMLVSMAVLTMLGGAFVAIIIHTIQGWSSGTSRAIADSAAFVAVAKLSADVRVGTAASVVSGELRVTVPPLVTDANGEKYYDPSSTCTTYRYYLSGGSIYRQIGSATATVFARDVSAVTFSVAGDLVSVAVTGSNRTGMSQSQRESSAHIVLRNFGS